MSPSLLTVQALTVIQELVALLSNHSEQYWQLMRHLLFNFHIWSRPDFSVRIGHTHFILTVVRDNLKECRSEFGVHYFLDVVRIFYRCEQIISRGTLSFRAHFLQLNGKSCDHTS